MNKLTAVHFNEVNNNLNLHTGTLVFITGVTNGSYDRVFFAPRIKEWIKQLRVKHPNHPVIAELRTLDKFLKKNKIDLVLC